MELSLGTRTVPRAEENGRAFQFFLGLPREIQLNIWEQALPEDWNSGRLITLDRHWEGEMYSGPCKIRERQQNGEGAYPSILPMLHACHDSRTIALKNHIPLYTDSLGGGLYFNPTLDVVMVDAMYGEFQLPGTGLDSIQLLAFLDPVHFYTQVKRRSTIAAHLAWFKQLKRVFVLEREELPWSLGASRSRSRLAIAITRSYAQRQRVDPSANMPQFTVLTEQEFRDRLKDGTLMTEN